MINWRQQMPPGEQGLRGQWLTTDGAKLGHGFASSGDCYLLALGNSINHIAAMIPQLPDRDFSHVGIVSRVIQTIPGEGRLAEWSGLRAVVDLRAVVNAEHVDGAGVLFDPVADAVGVTAGHLEFSVVGRLGLEPRAGGL